MTLAVAPRAAHAKKRSVCGCGHEYSRHLHRGEEGDVYEGPCVICGAECPKFHGRRGGRVDRARSHARPRTPLQVAFAELRTAIDAALDQFYEHLVEASTNGLVTTNGVAKPAKPPLLREVEQLVGREPPLHPKRTNNKTCRVAIINALTTHGAMPVARLALLTGYSKNGGSFRNTLSELRTAHELFTVAPGVVKGAWVATGIGGNPWGYWLRHEAVDGTMRAILMALQHTGEETVERIAEQTGYSTKGGSFRNALSRLRTLGLIEGVRGAPIKLAGDLGRRKDTFS